MATGYVVYRGASQLDGAPIVAVIVMESSNRKTGNMVQLYILRADVAPLAAIKSGADASICGDCKHRQSTGGACYVDIGRGPSIVYRTFLAGKYPELDADTAALLIEGRKVRLGAY